jgi:ribokinase
MAIYNLGSINIDHFYRLSHLPAPGETLATHDYSVGLGGKGANQSAAAAKAGAKVFHIGAVGPDEGRWAVDRLASWGVDVANVSRIGTPTGHAIINVDEGAENSIVIFPGANRALGLGEVELALSGAGPNDTLILQNETAHQVEAARIGKLKGMRVIYSAAPFDAEAVSAVLEYTTILAMNAVEAQQLTEALGVTLDQLPVPEILVTKGSEGAEWRSLATGERTAQAAIKVNAVDSTGAGDTFVGYFAAAMDAGETTARALRLASAAAALKVTRAGTADAIPTRAEVDAFLEEQ